jgi:hypothetical protein
VLIVLSIFGGIALTEPPFPFSLTQNKSTAAFARSTATVTADSLNLRSGPSTSSNVIKTLKKGDTVTITGSAVFDETLTAVANLTSTPPEELGALTYLWKRNGNTGIGTNATTYTLVQEDIGATITVTVTAANCTGSVTSNPTVVVTKATQTAPEAPTLLATTVTSITLNEAPGCEYNINGGAYQAFTTFSGLTPSTTYTFTQRKAETGTHLASPASAPANFTTNDPTGVFHTITVSVNDVAWGTITPVGEDGEVLVEEGSDITFHIAPNPGYAIENVLVNGIFQGEITTYTFNNVQSNGTISVIFKEKVGIVGAPLAVALQVWPNPTNGEITVSGERYAVSGIEVYDMFGRALMSYKSLMSPETTINLAHLQAGVYFLRITTEQGTVTKKVIKN